MFYRRFRSALLNCLRDRSGNFALMTAVLAPVMLGLTGGLVDLYVYQNQQALMKTAADFAALAAAKEASLKGWSAQTAREVADSIIRANVEGKAFSDGTSFGVDVLVDEAAKSVEVILEMNQHSFFVLGYFRNDPQIRVNSTARAVGETSLCVIGLDPASASTIKLSGEAKLTAPGCAVQSNSTSTDGLASIDEAVLAAAVTCSSGGYSGAPRNYAKAPTTDCTAIEDPLSSRTTADFKKCDYTNTVVKKMTATLQPGTYCGGILVDNNAFVTFAPGNYIIKDGQLRTRNSGEAVGDGVSFYFTGKDARFNFDGTSIVDFKAPETGPMAGLLFFEDPASPEGTIFEVSAKRAANLLGTIYLPKGTLKVHAKNKIAESSAYTVIVARMIDIGNLADMVINSNYAASAVPVPDGLGPSKSTITLTD